MAAGLLIEEVQELDTVVWKYCWSGMQTWNGPYASPIKALHSALRQEQQTMRTVTNDSSR